MKKLIVFNWKLNPASLKEAQKILNVLKIKNPQSRLRRGFDGQVKADIVICPPFVYLPISLSFIVNRPSLKLGSQDVFWEDAGAFTGEISPKMLKNLGVKYVIIGHSERREYLKETDEMINKKIKAALKSGLKVILCVGENLLIRKKKIESVKNFIKNQLKKDLNKIQDSLIVAYEPIWAIGTGNYCKPKDAVEIIKYIKKIINSKVIYGGSVNSKNISDYLNEKEIDGVLVGGASVNLKELKEILRTLKKC